jgi:tRNA A-37 threonylcarbamoyl transferase component Bud32
VLFHPARGEPLRSRGLLTADQLVELPGEVVSGHADRHVRRVELPGSDVVYYLKRQHHVGWRERLWQAVAGFGWVSRSEREARLLQQLESAGFACPNWVAVGEDGRGRAFLLVEELAGFVELRRLLSDTRVSLDRRGLAERAGQIVAELHAAGFTTPELTAKHVFVSPDSLAVGLLDWQCARRVARLNTLGRLRALAALHASLAEHLATGRERVRFFRAYRRAAGLPPSNRNGYARAIESVARAARDRRSIRDQRQPTDAGGQRLVWLADEAVCAVPDVAAVWPTPAVAPPFYSAEAPTDRVTTIRLPDGRPGVLHRFRTFAPLGRLVARLRGRSWRSPGATLGRVLFHLERYGIPAPRLLAFGQLETGPAPADSFALHEPPAGEPLDHWLARPRADEDRREVLDQVGLLLRQLHDAGCRLVLRGMPFRVDGVGRVSLGDVQAVRLARRVSDSDRRADRLALSVLLQTPIRTPER